MKQVAAGGLLLAVSGMDGGTRPGSFVLGPQTLAMSYPAATTSEQTPSLGSHDFATLNAGTTQAWAVVTAALPPDGDDPGSTKTEPNDPASMAGSHASTAAAVFVAGTSTVIAAIAASGLHGVRSVDCIRVSSDG